VDEEVSLSRTILLRGGRVVDPEAKTIRRAQILVRDGRIAALDDAEAPAPPADQVLDVDGMLVMPGLVDIHVHLREPGFEYKETVATGARAAVAGGVTSVACMANTKPVNDCPSVTRYILERAEAAALARVFPIGAVSVGLEGKHLAQFGGMREAGIVAVSDDGKPVMDAELMRRALEYTLPFGMPVIDHAEDCSLASGGVMNEGAAALRLGLRGIPSAAEEVMVARDISLAELTGGHLHVAHISTAGAVELVRSAKRKGVRITAEVTPHHLWLTDAAVEAYNTNAKMNPPLRSERDREALHAGLADGTIDIIATDHAPHHRDEKDCEFDCAAFGVVGLESLLPLTLRLVEEKLLDLPTAIAKVTVEPAKVLNLDVGRIAVGAPADLAIVDPEVRWTLCANELHSKSRNTPFDGWPMKGRAILTMVDGRIVHDLREVVRESVRARTQSAAGA
jgi:dihydroorotase